MGVVEVESNWDPNVISSSGACGLMQIIPAYARKEMAEVGANDILDPCQNIRVGTKLLANLIERYNGNVTAALMFYNEGYAGPARYFRTGKPSNYATKVLKIAQGYREEVPYATGCEAYS